MNIKGVGSLSLFYHTCKCGEMCVDGFPNQLEVHERTNRYVTFKSPPCKCGLVFLRRCKLTAGNPFRHRLIEWTIIIWKILPYVPKRLLGRVAGLSLWLEKRLPI